MGTPKFVVIDTETGGLCERSNPLLSVAAVVADENFEPVEGIGDEKPENLRRGFVLHVLPPPNTILAVPPEDMQSEDFKKDYSRPIEYYYNITTKEKLKTKPEDCQFINHGAADMNGFVEIKDGKWDIASIDAYLAKSLPVKQVDEILVQFISQAFKTKPVAVAHSAQFDIKYLKYHLPKLFANLHDKWTCTQKLLRKWYDNNNLDGYKKGATTLQKLAELASYPQEGAHEALWDCLSCLAGLKWLNGEFVKFAEQNKKVESFL